MPFIVRKIKKTRNRQKGIIQTIKTGARAIALLPVTAEKVVDRLLLLWG
ncbi:MAG: hypothetical protein F6K35_40190 [Okeania sp. SIO2H7]|nr:hypothetical protein [Okeania sp. SIO2H7]